MDAKKGYKIWIRKIYCHMHTMNRSGAEWAAAEGTHFTLEPVPSCRDPIYALVTTHTMSSSAMEAKGQAERVEQDKGKGKTAK